MRKEPHLPYLQVAGQLVVGDAQQKGGTIFLNDEALATTADVGRATTATTAAQQSANEAAQSAQQANTAATNVINDYNHWQRYRLLLDKQLVQ